MRDQTDMRTNGATAVISARDPPIHHIETRIHTVTIAECLARGATTFHRNLQATRRLHGRIAAFFFDKTAALIYGHASRVAIYRNRSSPCNATIFSSVALNFPWGENARYILKRYL